MNERRDQLGTGVAWGAWTATQVAWLALMARRVQLSAKWPDAAEAWAAPGMLAVQLVVACAMGRTLLKDLRTALSAIAVACPMLGLAVVIGGGRTPEAAAAMVCTAAWLGAIASVGSLRRDAVRAPLMGLLLVLSAGGPVLLYLAWEFGRRAVSADGMIAHLSPVLGATSTYVHGWSRISTIIAPVAIILGVGVQQALLNRSGKPKAAPTDEVGLKGLVG